MGGFSIAPAEIVGALLTIVTPRARGFVHVEDVSYLVIERLSDPLATRGDVDHAGPSSWKKANGSICHSFARRVMCRISSPLIA